MSTPPVTPNSVTPKAISPIHGGELGKIRAFLLDHEKLLIVLVAAIVIWVGYGKITDIIANHDNAQLQQQRLINDAQIAKNQAMLEQQQKDDAIRAKDEADRQAEAAKLQQQNAALVQANTALAAALTQRQKQDASLSLPELALRWEQLVPSAGLSTTQTGLGITPEGAHATVNELEKVPALSAELTNEQTKEANLQTMLTSSNESIGLLNQSITDRDGRIEGLNTLMVGNKKQCEDEKKVIKDAARKSKRRWFVIGFVSGFVSRQAIKSYLGF
jgi:hypothetical protein